MTEKPQLTLYNSLTRQKEVFTPQDPARVTMYNCGPTVYSYAHIGNARAAVVADVLFRVLRHIYGKDGVVYARNITDVDDKIIAAAKEQGVPISEITEKYARIYNEDLAALGCLDPTHQPKATEHIPHMIEMIEKLLATGPDEYRTYAYVSDGHVFFDVSTYDAYGKLSGNTLDALKKGDRVGEGEVARKKNAADFVLWKPELDGVGWDAPFGRGRPGWHIECSAMAKATLGEVIDIHCGGVDLKFPHHENEIAQSCCANGHEVFANYWVHNEFLNMGSEKMSKSLGNVTLIRDLLEEWDGEVIRLALLWASHRNELAWLPNIVRAAQMELDRNYRRLSFVPKRQPKLPKRFTNPFLEGFYDDLSFSRLRFGLEEMLFACVNSKWNHGRMKYHFDGKDIVSIELKIELADYIHECADLLGILQKDPEAWFRGGADSDKFDALVKEYDSVRAEAITAKEAGDKPKMGELFSRADAIRDELKSDGIAIETGPTGSTWRKA